MKQTLLHSVTNLREKSPQARPALVAPVEVFCLALLATGTTYLLER